jgi:predicted Zn-ribbon and HTH transcriptional regulator
MSNKNIVKLLKGRNPQRVQEMAKKLGLKKNKYTLYDLDMVKESLKEYAEKIGSSIV